MLFQALALGQMAASTRESGATTPGMAEACAFMPLMAAAKVGASASACASLRADDARTLITVTRPTHAVDVTRRVDLMLCRADYSWCAGDVFDGCMSGNTRHGPCSYTFFNGRRLECQWNNGRCPEFNETQKAVLAGFSIVAAALERIGVAGQGGAGAALRSFRRAGE